MLNIKKEIRSFGYAFKGILSAFKSEMHIKIHTIIALPVIFSGFVLKISATEWTVCLLCIGLVVGMELLNTAVEKIIDLVSPEHNELAGKAKDIAAGAVLVCASVSVVIGIIIFAPKILH
ncbi:diacylglycerol kinase [Bacteroidia bacterium]|nr:diacylglycerol kinase [Bacteroidia bacterium]